MQEVLRVGICDDEEVVYHKMNQLIAEYGEQNHIAMEVQYYKSGMVLIESDEIADMDILFLDIDMPELDGVETAYKLNERKHHCKIVMLTSKVERFKEAFKIGAFRFVTKPIEQKEVFDAIDDVRTRMIGNKTHELQHGGHAYTVLQRDILYVMRDKTSVYVFTEKCDFRHDESLSWWEQELDNRMFVRCHKGYIVNMKMIVDIKKDEVCLITGERIPVARRKAKEVEKQLMEYDTKYR